MRKDRPETEELSQRPWNTGVLHKGTRVSPILETVSSLVRTSSGSQDDTEDDEAHDRQDFDRCEPELAFAIYSGTSKVYSKDDDEADGDPDAIVD